MKPGATVRIEAPAKVNLILRILERMPDGYHRLETLFQAVGLCDRITLELTPARELALRVEGADVGPAADNLAVRAARLFRERTGVGEGVRIVLEKRIPAGAGLGGGSSDAGAVLRALNQVYGFPLTAGELGGLGAGLGADVAFFTGGAGRALGEGRGDRLTPLPPLPPRTLILGLPPVHVATGEAYAALARARGERPPPPPLRRPLPGDWGEVERRAVNDFQEVVAGAHPAIADALRALRTAGASPALLSGSGGAVFGLFPGGEPDPGVVEGLRRDWPRVRWEEAAALPHLPAPVRVEPGGALQ